MGHGLYIAGAALFSVILGGIGNIKYDFSSTEWTYQGGLEGEYLGLDKINLANSSLWIQGSAAPVDHTLIWYKTTFLALEGKGPIALNLASMGKVKHVEVSCYRYSSNSEVFNISLPANTLPEWFSYQSEPSSLDVLLSHHR